MSSVHTLGIKLQLLGKRSVLHDANEEEPRDYCYYRLVSLAACVSLLLLLRFLSHETLWITIQYLATKNTTSIWAFKLAAKFGLTIKLSEDWTGILSNVRETNTWLSLTQFKELKAHFHMTRWSMVVPYSGPSLANGQVLYRDFFTWGRCTKMLLETGVWWRQCHYCSRIRDSRVA